MTKRIEALYAWVMDDQDEEQGEGIIAGASPAVGGWMPLVMGKRRVAELPQVRELAQGCANLQGKRVRLVRFTRAEELVVLEPGKGDA